MEGALPPLRRLAAAASGVLLAAMAVAILAAAGLGPDWPRWTGWGAVAVSGLAAGLNLVTPSEAERRLWGPFTVIMALLAMVVMTG